MQARYSYIEIIVSLPAAASLRPRVGKRPDLDAVDYYEKESRNLIYAHY